MVVQIFASSAKKFAGTIPVAIGKGCGRGATLSKNSHAIPAEGLRLASFTNSQPPEARAVPRSKDQGGDGLTLPDLIVRLLGVFYLNRRYAMSRRAAA
jgi:hypothetical protein